MEYMTTKEAEKKWNISERRIRQLLQDNRIEGANKVGNSWNIPIDADKPVDKRIIKPIDNKFIINLNNNYFDEVDSLKKELDSNKYEVVCFEKVPYSVFVSDYKNNKENIKFMKYEVDLLIKEKQDNNLIPRIIIESKYKTFSTHDAITYSDKAKGHKELYSGLRYGFMIGNSNEKYIASRLMNHGSNFDFMIAFLPYIWNKL